MSPACAIGMLLLLPAPCSPAPPLGGRHAKLLLPQIVCIATRSSESEQEAEEEAETEAEAEAVPIQPGANECLDLCVINFNLLPTRRRLDQLLCGTAAHFEGNSSWDRAGGLGSGSGSGTGESDPCVINCKTAAWADQAVVAGKNPKKKYCKQWSRKIPKARARWFNEVEYANCL